jgi:hypothetical protein
LDAPESVFNVISKNVVVGLIAHEALASLHLLADFVDDANGCV